MSVWNQQNLHKHMRVYASDGKELGHIVEVYEDSFQVEKGAVFSKGRYYPYSVIEKVENERVELQMNASEAEAKEWEKRPDYEDHLADPTQLFYDRGHGVHDPFDESNPEQG